MPDPGPQPTPSGREWERPAPRPVACGPYPPIEDYALLSDCDSLALAGRNGSIDWCCMPEMDSDSCFGRLLDWQRGGHCSIAPADLTQATSQRWYEPGSMVLATTFHTGQGQVLLHDFFALEGRPGHHSDSDHLVRIAECRQGEVGLRVEVAPRFDYGAIVPELREVVPGLYTAWGSNQGLLIRCDPPLRLDPKTSSLIGDLPLREGERVCLSIRFVRPEDLDACAQSAAAEPWALDPEKLLAQTIAWWSAWETADGVAVHADPQTRRSALVLKALCSERTGAMVAAATTSLPEAPGGSRNWDYRFSWIRDSVLAVSELYALGHVREADRFRAFIERSAAGHARQLQVMYGVDGRRRLTELQLDHLEGWRGARPVRIGNAAADQVQLDIYGNLLQLAWMWHDSAESIDRHYWDFLVRAVDATCERWQEPDHGIWEMRAEPRHFVHSKMMCWVALDRGLRLAQRHGAPAPLERWQRVRELIRHDIEERGYDSARGVYRQAYGETHPDASLLLLPKFGYLPHDDPRMARTVDWIAAELERDGLLLRYAHHDGLPEREGVFLPCTFWLAEALAGLGRRDEALRCYERAAACANELGLFSEECLREGRGMLGNFPQAFTHLSQLSARLALDGMEAALKAR
ncbi:MAG: glycoside hydrolase family 15 protein [Rhizobacter sp.]|nr:glycoside hydrolase family 15 protein [Rhizobacter sp.]